MATAATVEPKAEFEVENCRVCINVKDWAARVQKATLARKATTGMATAILVATGAEAETSMLAADQCPPDSAVLGRATWTLLHTMSAYYPQNPSPSQQADMHGFLSALARFYPCQHCASHMRYQMEVDPPQATSRSALAAWLCRLHNEVNVRLGKPVFDCARVYERWREGPASGSCDESDIHIR